MNNHCLYSVFIIGAYVLRREGCHISLHPRDHSAHMHDMLHAVMPISYCHESTR
nr:MAG TPA: hypothetical protein [Caudoviricetes sp.]